MRDKKQFNLLVDGSIASGKTTFVNYLANYDDYCRQNIQVFEEPIKEWQDLRGFNLLKLFYDNPIKFAFPFESFVMLSMNKYHQIPTDGEKTIKVLERSLFSAKYCFIDLLKEMGCISQPEFIVLDEWFEQLLKMGTNLDIDLILYVKTNPRENLARLQARGREEEKNTCLGYLEALDTKYEKWLGGDFCSSPVCPIWILDTSRTLEETLEGSTDMISDLKEFINQRLS